MIYDPVEAYLLAMRDVGKLTLENRITNLDRRLIAQGDESLHPTPKDPLELTVALLTGAISGEQAEFAKDDGDFMFYVVERPGSFVYQVERYCLRFLIHPDLDVKIRNQEEINAYIANGSYVWDIEVDEFDPGSRDGVGLTIADFLISKKTTQGGQTNTITESSYFPSPVALSIADRVADTFEDDEPKYVGLRANLHELTQKYPQGTVVDPLDFAKDFIKAITE